MKKLSFDTPHDNDEWNSCTSQEDCADPQKNSWVVSSVYTVVTDNFKQKLVLEWITLLKELFQTALSMLY
jgi:hypothetical protein